MMRFIYRPEFGTSQWPFRFTMAPDSLAHPRANTAYGEVRKWLSVNLTGHWTADFAAGVYMDRDSDAFAFRMRWC